MPTQNNTLEFAVPDAPTVLTPLGLDEEIDAGLVPELTEAQSAEGEALAAEAATAPISEPADGGEPEAEFTPASTS